MMAASIMTRAERREHAREHLLAFGDLDLFEVVLDALEVAPSKVFEFAIDHCTFVMVGRDSSAWTSSARLLDREGKARERLIVLGSDVDFEIVLHEISHAMRADLSDSVQAISCAGEVGLREYAAANGLLLAFWRDEAEEELRARDDARAWLHSTEAAK